MIRRSTPILLTTVLAALLTGVAPGGPERAQAAAPSTPMAIASGAERDDLTTYSLGRHSFRAGSLYIAFLKLAEKEDPVDASPGIVGTGTDWIQIDDGGASTAGMGLSAYRFSPATDRDGVALSVGPLSSRHEGMWFSIVRVASGFDRPAPVLRSKAGSGAAATGFTLSFPDIPAPDSLVLAAFAHGAAETSTPNAGWAEVPGSDLSHPYPAQAAHVIYDATEPGRSPGSTWATAAARRGLAIEIAGDDGSNGVILAAAGDICKDPGDCARTSDRVAEVRPDVVVTLGDLAYNDGLLSEYLNRYGGGTTPQSSWGRPSIKEVTLPGYGNHDCRDAGSKLDCDDAVRYFGPDGSFGTDIPGTPGSYWTVRRGWLIVHLNSAGDQGSGQATDAEVDAQNTALRNLLQADDHRCEVLAWHHSRYSSGSDHGNETFIDPWFDTAYANGVDVVLSAHDHDYERFAPQDGNGNGVPGGVRAFVVGTGGAPQLPFGTPRPNSRVRIVDLGILTMELNDGAYTWAFLDDETGQVDDSGSGACHT